MREAAAESRVELERLYHGQLLGLGAMALEMHQSGELDDDAGYDLRTSCATLMRVAAEAADTERQLGLARD